MLRKNIWIYCFVIVLVISFFSVIFPVSNTVLAPAESYLSEDAKINYDYIPYYGFTEPLKSYSDTEREDWFLERKDDEYELYDDGFIFTYRYYNQGVEIVDVTYMQYLDSINSLTINIPSNIEGKPVIKLGGTINESEEYIYNSTDCEGYFLFSNCFETFNVVEDLNLKKIHISKNVKEIIDGTFKIGSLEKIVVSKDNPYYSSKDGILYDKSGKIKLCVPLNHHSRNKD